MLHPESHQIERKREIAQIPKTEGRWLTESGRKGQSLGVLGHARHGGSRAQPGVRCHFQQQRTVSFRRYHLHRRRFGLVEEIVPQFPRVRFLPHPACALQRVRRA